jgi:hypothetical protein
MTVQARKITLTPPNAGTIPVRQNFYGYGFRACRRAALERMHRDK